MRLENETYVKALEQFGSKDETIRDWGNLRIGTYRFRIDEPLSLANHGCPVCLCEKTIINR